MELAKLKKANSMALWSCIGPVGTELSFGEVGQTRMMEIDWDCFLFKTLIFYHWLVQVGFIEPVMINNMWERIDLVYIHAMLLSQTTELCGTE